MKKKRRKHTTDKIQLSLSARLTQSEHSTQKPERKKQKFLSSRKKRAVKKLYSTTTTTLRERERER